MKTGKPISTYEIYLSNITISDISFELLIAKCDNRLVVGVRMSQLLFFAEELEKEPVKNKGKLVVASGVLKLLEGFAPKEFGHGAK